MQKIKLLWDFRGPNAKKIANHHLKDFFKVSDKKLFESGIKKENEFHHFSFVVILNKDLESVKLNLKPNRGQKVK
tara:strand:+ start:4219 stop:4443 length:225 start_codon:yes stop_codon:yes gene_type:complete